MHEALPPLDPADPVQLHARLLQLEELLRIAASKDDRAELRRIADHAADAARGLLEQTPPDSMLYGRRGLLAIRFTSHTGNAEAASALIDLLSSIRHSTPKAVDQYVVDELSTFRNDRAQL